MTIWVPAGTISTPGGTGSWKKDGNIYCYVVRSQGSIWGKTFSPGMGADSKTCILPQFSHWWITSKAERLLCIAEYPVFLLRLPISSCFLFQETVRFSAWDSLPRQFSKENWSLSCCRIEQVHFKAALQERMGTKFNLNLFFYSSVTSWCIEWQL